MPLNENLIAKISPLASEKYIIRGEGYRLTLLSASMLRIETNPDNEFNDFATQSVWFRDFCNAEFSVSQRDNFLNIVTEKVEFLFDKKKKKLKSVTFSDDKKTVKCANNGNLKGTARTLDFTYGKIPLKNGVISKTGLAVLDDSKSLLLINGEIAPMRNSEKDLYIFAYGKRFRECIGDFYKLTGNVPLIPRYALGNWWSRYHAYTQEEYIKLMERFIAEDIPISVATVDMDWHWVYVNEKFNLDLPRLWAGKEGWTGYSWNTDLFSDYKGFLTWLQNHNLKVPLNLHPSDGVRSFETMYPEMAKATGIDPETKQTVQFDITSPEFINAYFKYIHNPYEKEGVDFWWIDWQQGKNTRIKGLDPLWSLNHYHFLDSKKDNKRPLILSRYAGAGSHRYPLGFSGDTIILWSSLKFQPYFTANAANIGYTWWSHDIGGHTFGIRSDELYLRWLQFGIFSPVNRLHSTSHDLQGKEPWNFSPVTERYAKEFLQLRHKLLPYIYTMNYRNHNEGIAVCEPLYYNYPGEENAYKFKNEYFFGSELIVSPVVSKINKKILMSETKVWLPEGRWTDIFTGRMYQGGKEVKMHRALNSIPALAKEGAIIPLGNNKGNDSGNPSNMSLLLYRGNNDFTLYEDDGESLNYEKGEYAKTLLSLRQDKDITFKINKAEGILSLLPAQRAYRLEFKDITGGNISAKKNEQAFDDIKVESGENISVIFTAKPADFIEITIADFAVKVNLGFRESSINILSRYQKSNLWKSILYRKLININDKDTYIRKVKKMIFINKAVKNALLEVLED